MLNKNQVRFGLPFSRPKLFFSGFLILTPECSIAFHSSRGGEAVQSTKAEKHFPLSRQSPFLIVLSVFILYFFLQRGGLLLYGYSHIAHPHIDELVSGTLTCDLLDGNLRASIFAYQYTDFTGEVLIEGVLLAPFYKMFGRSLLVMKLFPLICSFIALLLWASVVRRYWGNTAAVIFAALFAFPPPMFARLNVVATISSHHMICLFIACQIFLLFRIIEKDKHSISPWLVLWFGFFAGLGTYAYYSYILFNLFCIAFFVIFRAQVITLRRIVFFGGGIIIGFSPWIVRLYYTSGGLGALRQLFKGSGIDLWQVAQTFFYAVPRSLGYNYPSQQLGLMSVCFMFFVFFLMCVLLLIVVKRVFAVSGNFQISNIQNLQARALLSIFVCLFPLFFLFCLALSSKQITPFEYHRGLGLFATFPPIDFIRFRYLHILYPFYFAVAAIGTVVLYRYYNRKIYAYVAVALCVLFIFAGALKSVQMYSADDSFKTLYYKGYSYDLLAPALMLDLFYGSKDTSFNLKKAEAIAAEYPSENKSAAYKCLGSNVVLSILNGSKNTSELNDYFRSVPAIYLDDFIFGIVRTSQMIPHESFVPFAELVSKKYPERFYTYWGFRFLAYKYMAGLVNREALFDNIPGTEKWFYKTFLSKYNELFVNAYQNKARYLRDEIKHIPSKYQSFAVRGLGVFVGAEMLFAPFSIPEFPYSMQIGSALPQDLQEHFYEGIGIGFAETLCRFWRRIIPPDKIPPSCYKKMLTVEWKRCQSLMSKLPASILFTVKKGLEEGLKKRHLSSEKRKFVDGLLRNSKLF